MISVDPDAITFLHANNPSVDTKAAVPEIPGPQKESETSTADVVEETTQLAEKSNPSSSELHLQLPDYAAPFIFIPAYLEVSFNVCSAVYVRHPTARPGYSELPTPYDADGEVMRLAWEWYVKVRPRMRGRIQRETGPHGTRRPDPYWSQYQK